MTTSTPSVTITLAQADAIAHLLGADWEAYEDPRFASDYARHQRATLRYVGPDADLQGAYIYCTCPYWSGGKWHWAGQAHGPDGASFADILREPFRSGLNTSINCSPTKPLPHVAKDIQRRLLTPYLPAYRAALQLWRTRQEQRMQDNALAQDLAGLLGVAVHHLREHGRDEATIYGGQGSPLYQLRISHSHVWVEHMTLTPGQARQFVVLARQWQTTEQA